MELKYFIDELVELEKERYEKTRDLFTGGRLAAAEILQMNYEKTKDLNAFIRSCEMESMDMLESGTHVEHELGRLDLYSTVKEYSDSM